MDKTISTLEAAVADVSDNAVLMIGGFGGSGAPIDLIHALIDRYKATGSPAKLTVINNNAGNVPRRRQFQQRQASLSPCLYCLLCVLSPTCFCGRAWMELPGFSPRLVTAWGGGSAAGCGGGFWGW